MNSTLAKYRRGWHLSLLLVLLLSGNELLHLHCHGHLHDTDGNGALFEFRAPDRYPESFVRSHRFPQISPEEFSCPFCSAAIDLLSTPASVDVQFDPLPSTVARCDLAPPVFCFSFSHRPRSPPQA